MTDLEMARRDIAALYPHMSEADIDAVMEHVDVIPKLSNDELHALATQMAKLAATTRIE
jgi:hypothetical protein